MFLLHVFQLWLNLWIHLVIIIIISVVIIFLCEKKDIKVISCFELLGAGLAGAASNAVSSPR